MSMLLWSIIIVSCGLMILTIFLFIRWFLRRNKIQVHILREYGDMYKIIHSRRISMHLRTFNFKEDAFKIELEKAVLNKKNKPILYFLLGEAEPQRFKPVINPKNSEDFKTVISAKLFKTIMKRAEMDSFYLVLIVALGIGIVVVGVFAIWQITSLMNTIARLQQVNPTVIT